MISVCLLTFFGRGRGLKWFAFHFFWFIMAFDSSWIYPGQTNTKLYCHIPFVILKFDNLKFDNRTYIVCTNGPRNASQVIIFLFCIRLYRKTYCSFNCRLYLLHTINFYYFISYSHCWPIVSKNQMSVTYAQLESQFFNVIIQFYNLLFVCFFKITGNVWYLVGSI